MYLNNFLHYLSKSRVNMKTLENSNSADVYVHEPVCPYEFMIRFILAHKYLENWASVTSTNGSHDFAHQKCNCTFEKMNIEMNNYIFPKSSMSRMSQLQASVRQRSHYRKAIKTFQIIAIFYIDSLVFDNNTNELMSVDRSRYLTV